MDAQENLAPAVAAYEGFLADYGDAVCAEDETLQALELVWALKKKLCAKRTAEKTQDEAQAALDQH